MKLKKIIVVCLILCTLVGCQAKNQVTEIDPILPSETIPVPPLSTSEPIQTKTPVLPSGPGTEVSDLLQNPDLPWEIISFDYDDTIKVPTVLQTDQNGNVWSCYEEGFVNIREDGIFLFKYETLFREINRDVPEKLDIFISPEGVVWILGDGDLFSLKDFKLELISDKNNLKPEYLDHYNFSWFSNHGKFFISGVFEQIIYFCMFTDQWVCEEIDTANTAWPSVTFPDGTISTQPIDTGIELEPGHYWFHAFNYLIEYSNHAIGTIYKIGISSPSMFLEKKTNEIWMLPENTRNTENNVQIIVLQPDGNLKYINSTIFNKTEYSIWYGMDQLYIDERGYVWVIAQEFNTNSGIYYFNGLTWMDLYGNRVGSETQQKLAQNKLLSGFLVDFIVTSKNELYVRINEFGTIYKLDLNQIGWLEKIG